MGIITAWWTANLVIRVAMCITSDSCAASGAVTWNSLGAVGSPGVMCGCSDGDCGNKLRWVGSDGKIRELGIRTRTFRKFPRTECSTVKGEILSRGYSRLRLAPSLPISTPPPHPALLLPFFQLF
jgi:hypothetical protein